MHRFDPRLPGMDNLGHQAVSQLLWPRKPREESVFLEKTAEGDAARSRPMRSRYDVPKMSNYTCFVGPPPFGLTYAGHTRNPGSVKRTDF